MSKTLLVTLTATLLLPLAACEPATNSGTPSAVTQATEQTAASQVTGQTSSQSSETQSINAEQSVVPAVPRRIIRDATFTLEAQDPTSTARRIEVIAEQRGGYVTSSEAEQTSYFGRTNDERAVRVTVVARVPAENFAATLDQIRALGTKVSDEKITGRDVTAEYLDLEARIRAKQALETQFLEIMRSARAVTEALEVQRQLGDVRAEIEQLEGRRRLLENQAALSTITITVEPPAPIISTRPGSFFSNLLRAFGTGFDAAVWILLTLIQVLVALIPIVALIGLPIVVLRRFIKKRRRARSAATTININEPPTPPPSVSTAP